MSSKLALEFQQYEAFHQTRENKATHYVGIPVLIVAILGLLAQVNFTVLNFQTDLGVVLWIVATIYYIYLDWRIGLPFSLVTAICHQVGLATRVEILLGLFVLGWVFQLVGHYVYEKKAPALTTNLKHILIGPIWIFCNIVNYRAS